MGSSSYTEICLLLLQSCNWEQYLQGCNCYPGTHLRPLAFRFCSHKFLIIGLGWILVFSGLGLIACLFSCLVSHPWIFICFRLIASTNTGFSWKLCKCLPIWTSLLLRRISHLMGVGSWMVWFLILLPTIWKKELYNGFPYSFWLSFLQILILQCLTWLTEMGIKLEMKGSSIISKRYPTLL